IALNFSCLFFASIYSCKEKTTSLPILSYNYDEGKKATYRIEDFSFVNQDSLIFTSANTLGKVHTFNFFFTSCPSICPPMRLQQLEIAKTFQEEPKFMQCSISIDLKRDSISTLKNFADVFEINSKNWNLLRAKSEKELHEMAGKLKTNFKPNDDYTDFYHSSYVALIDKEQYIRGFYNLLLPKDVELLKADIFMLLKD